MVIANRAGENRPRPLKTNRKMKRTAAFLAALALFSCQGPSGQAPPAEQNASYRLEATDERISIPLDEGTPVTSFCMFPYFAPDGTRYLAYLNEGRFEILFFDLDKQALSHRVTLAQDGENKVGEPKGFRVLSLDSIFVTPAFTTVTFLVNREGEVLDRFDYGELTGGMPFFARSGTGIEMDFVGSRMFIPLRFPGGYGDMATQEERERHRLCGVYDTAARAGQFLDFSFPEDYWETGFKPMSFSRVLANGRFAYSFYFHHDIFLCDPEHATVERKPARSALIEELRAWDYEDERYLEYLTSAPQYRNIIHDPYRKLYYRLVKHAFALEPEHDLLRELRYPARFSVMIFDEDFNLLGETLLPERTYYAYGFIVAEEGLYFQQSHPDHPDFTEDSLVFRLFKPVQNEI